ncbi:DNA polymerase III subunit delta [Sphingomonas turrisvirgatae]|uniref:DNA-directed DNA polymerase n=1 Tax=Sphingomonas turrisvirgatae TaxID=1888892 RepID=A0A1E3LS01_9SPHN|nr:DNA polymerase III subunit delta [Sphingomonas turrisvirgatae]ODP35975.1 DNA polymerase III subunit delta [Sphingomonas turrisvirgatae]
MKVSEAQIRVRLDKPGPDVRLFLLYGPDEAGANELAARLGRAMGSEAERIDVEGSQLKGDPARLAEEAASLSLFGSRRYVRVTGIDDDGTEAVRLLLETDVGGNPVVAIGGALKGTGRLLKLALASPAAMAHACYIPDARNAGQLAAGIAREHGLRLVGGTADRLASLSGGDRAVLAREIEKLSLYLDAAPDRPREAGMAALDAIGADLGEAEMFGAIGAVVEGRTADIGVELARLDNAGVSAIPLLRQLVRKLMSLAEMRGDMDRGASADEVIKKYRVFFKEEMSTKAALRRWSSPMLARAVERVRAAERAVTRGGGNAGPVLAEEALTTLARAAARAR